MNKYPFRQRLLAMLMSVLCVVGLIPTQAFAASSIPDEITLKKADYPTGASANGLETYNAPNGLDEVTVHNFRVIANGEELTGFCGDHRKVMGNRWNAEKWENPGPVDPKVYPLLAFYYWSCENDPTFNGGESGWANQVTNTYIQCVIWLAKAGRLPDYHSDRDGWIAAVAEQRQAAYDHYNCVNDPEWTHEMDAAARIDQYEAGMYGKDWNFREYFYYGENGSPQPIIIGLRNAPQATYSIKKVDTMGNNISGVTFRVVSENGSFMTTVTTNSSGVAEFNSDAGDGWYTITETDAPDGYEQNHTPVRVYLTAGSTGTIRLANTKTITEPGELKIRKVDIDDPTQGIAGAVIRLTHPASGRTATFTSGADGWVVIPEAWINEMNTGLWQAEEITPPTGYRLNPDPNITKQSFVWDGGRTPVSLVFTNDSDVSIRFRKVDADAPTRGLAGATIAVYKDGTPITTAVTDAQGYITLNGVTEGFYVFKELNPPAGYALDVDPYVGVHIDPAQIAGNETIEVTMVNHKTPTLRIRKVDAETGNGIANTRFSVVGVNNNYSNTVTTDADGWAVLTDVDAAVYEITELSVPAPYILDTNNRMTVALRADEDHSFTFTNGKEPGLRIIKKDLISGDVVPGVTFRIEKIDGTYSTELTTDAHGEVFFERIAAGAYRVQEIAVPGDYLLSDEIKTVNLEANKTTTLEFFNSKKPGLRIFKKDAVTDEYVSGVTFRIEKIDGTFSTELTTDAHGEVFIPNLAAGAYRVQEVAVPGNYILDTTVKTVTLEADRTAILEFRNYQRPGLLIKKTTSDGQNLEGARFNVKVKDGSSIGDFTTDARGEIFIPNLTAQWYTITETYVPEGYILDSTPHDVLLEAGASGDGKVYQTYSVVNHAKPKLTVYKVDSVVGGSVEGAKFQITFAGENQNGSVRDLGVHVSDHNGDIKLDNLDVGWYRVTETEAPDGYQLKAPSEQTIYLRADDVKSLTFENTPLNAIIVVKRDSVTGEPVEGCTFQLRYLGGASGTGGTVVDTQTTSTTGTITWTRLQAGTYVVEEIRAADGYVMTDTAKTVYLSGNAQDTVTVYFDNSPKGGLLIKKVCSNNPNVMLEGAQFEVKYTDGTFIGNANGIYTSDANGEVLISDLEPNKSVIVTEVRAPDGFVKDTAPQSIEIKAGRVVTLTFANAPKGRLIIEKRDSTNNQLLEGAEFRVTTAAGCEVGQNGVIGTATVTSAGLFRTGADGKITLTNLLPGTYIITEVNAPDGYLIDEPTKTVTITKGDTATVVFKDTPKGTLTVLKLDSRTQDPLEGAQFRITDSSGAALENHGGTLGSNGYYTTNADGRIDIYDVEPGSYIATEVKAPNGYRIDNTSQTVLLNANDHKTLKFYNTALTTLIIHKYIDGTNNEPLQGVRFKVVDGEGAAVGPDDGVYYTDANGEIVLTGLQPGTTVKAWETKTVAGFVLDGTPQDIQIKAGDAQTLTFWNKRLGSLVVNKLDSLTNEPISGAEFRITYADGRYLDNEGGQISSNGRYVTDANGEIRITGFIGTVVVEEVKAPDGYVLDEGTKKQTVTVNPADTQTLTFKNTPKQTLTIHKYVDGTGEPLEGVKFKLTYGNNAPVGGGSGEFTTNANGEINVPNLVPGDTIIAREVATVDGFVLDTTPQSITIAAGGDNSLTFYNKRAGTLVVKKLDSISKTPLAGAEFKIAYDDGRLVAGESGQYTGNGLYVTDANGEIRITGFIGTVVVEEVKAPEGYTIVEAEKRVTVVVSPAKTETLTFLNIPLQTLRIQKYADGTNTPLAGVTYSVAYADGKPVGSGQYMTDANGQIAIPGLPVGATVDIREIKTAKGYALNPYPQTIVISAATCGNGQIVGGNAVGGGNSVTFYNVELNTLTIHKYITGTQNEPLKGVEFKVTDGSGKAVGSSNGVFYTDAQGNITIPNLEAGMTLTVRETKALDGYVLDGTPQTITISGGGENNELTFWNAPQGVLIVKKLDSMTKEPLAGAEFKITYDNGAFVDNANGHISSNGVYKTDANGEIRIAGLTGTVTVEETKAPDGYILDPNSAKQTVKVNASDTQTLTFYNTPIGGLTIYKVDEDSGKRLSGAKIEVRRMNGAIVGTYVSDKNGVIRLPQLDDGWYELTELKAPDGYILDATPQKVEVRQGKTTVFEFENVASASMLIHKVCSVTGAGLQGAKFVLYDRSMTPIGEYESDNNGYVHLSQTLKDGRYYVREIVAPEGYILDNSTKSFYVTSGETAMIEWENTPQLAQIQIVKTSADYNRTNGLPAGTPLADAIYTVYDKRMNVVDTIQTNSSGIANTKPLPLGFYHVKETTAPANYGIDTATYDVELEFVGQVYRLNLTNKSVSARVAIRKSGPQLAVNGQNMMMYRVSGVRNDSTVALQSFYWRDTLPTDAFRLTSLTTGTYSSTQTYKVTYTTNYDSTWRTAYDNLTTAKSYALDMSATALGLRGGEYVTEVMLSFGVVPAGFHQLTEAAVYGSVLRELVNGYQFTNKVDVGGLLGGHWEQGIARWTTTVKSTWTPPALPKLPRTGY